MGSDAPTGQMPADPEDTVELGERLDPVRTLLRRAAGGDRHAASSLVDVLGPRIHGLGMHVTGSTAKAVTLTVRVLRSCLRDAGQLAAGGLPGEAAVLDRARRAAASTRPSGDVRSLVASEAAADRTRDRREVDVLRVLLTLPPQQRALVESAAQGRFPYEGPRRADGAALLSQVLDRLVPLGGPELPELRSLAALDALALADQEERARLREQTRTAETAGIHRHAIEAAARLTLLTSVPPSRDLHAEVLEGFAPPAPVPSAPQRTEAEPAYQGSYDTPVLGTDSQQRMVGPPAVAGGGAATAPAATPSPAPPRAAGSAAAPAPAPAFSFRPADEAGRARRDSRRRRRASRRGDRGVPWLSRSLAVLALCGALVLTWVVVDTRGALERERDFAATWTELSLTDGAQLVPGLSDNGTWAAVITDDGIALRAEDVTEYDREEVLQLWGETDGVPTDLGVLEVGSDGTIRHRAAGTADQLLVTREMAPQNLSGTPSSRVVASLDPGETGS